MRKPSDDVVQFVHQHFDRCVIPTVYQTIECLGTLRVVRAVLFLSGGSITLLKHYVDAARADVRKVLTWAEYIVDVAPEPMFVRDMSRPFPAQDNGT